MQFNFTQLSNKKPNNNTICKRTNVQCNLLGVEPIWKRATEIAIKN